MDFFPFRDTLGRIAQSFHYIPIICSILLGTSAFWMRSILTRISGLAIILQTSNKNGTTSYMQI